MSSVTTSASLPCHSRVSLVKYRECDEILILPCGSLAQLVEQRPEEPRVPSSSLGGATKQIVQSLRIGLFAWLVLPRPELEAFCEAKIVPRSQSAVKRN